MLVNYVWINETDFGGDAERGFCGVPLTNIDKVIENADLYTDAKFILWMDYELLDQESVYWVGSCLYSSGVQNVEIRNIREIDAYSSQPDIFDRQSHIAARSDLARLLVLDHCLGDMANQNSRYVFYSDFDVSDIAIGCIDDEELKRPLPKYLQVYRALSGQGMVYAATRRVEVENSFMGFDRDNEDAVQFLSDVLIPEATDTIRNGFKNEYVDGWTPFYHRIRDYCASRAVSMSGMTVRGVVADSGYRLRPNPLYAELGLNPV